ncbi:MAG TPA: helix-turn-helix domain-containing protein [Armatimonadota bacterium]
MTDANIMADSTEIGRRLRELRQRANLSIRQLAKRAGVVASYISGVEAGRISPTIATLRKLLLGLNTDLGAFFSEPLPSDEERAFRHAAMRTAEEARRSYTFILPRRPDIPFEMVDETIMPGDTPEFEILSSDIAGYVLHGDLLLEVEGEERQLLQTNDAFFVPAGRPVRGYSARDDHPVRLLSVYSPPRY